MALLSVGAGAGAGAAHARAVPGAGATLFVGAPEVVADKGEIATLVGAVRADGTPAKLDEVRLLLDGSDAGPATAREGFAEYAAEHPKWTPPISVGLVYLWAKGTPEAVIDGVESLLKRLPSRTTIYPTPYGQGYRPVITRLTAGRAAGGELRDTPAIEGDQYKLIEAIRFNARKLGEDGAPIKHLVIVTDGRDYEAARDPHAFAAVGDELRKKRLRVEVVWFRSGTDAPENVTGMRELVEAARARQVSADRVGDLPAIVESLTDSLIGLERVHFALPWGKRMFGGKPKVGIKATVDGAVVSATDGTVPLPGGLGILFVIAGVIVVAGGVGGGIWLWRRKGGGGMTPLLDELQNLVRLGVTPDEAVVDLSQAFPGTVKKLIGLDISKLPPDRYRTLRTRAGKARVRDIQKLLATEEPTIDSDMAEVLAKAASDGADPREAARRLRAKVGGDKWSALARADSRELKKSLESAGKAHAGLASAKAVGFAAEVQQALRGRDAKAVGVAWLVRVSGPGARGQTLRVPIGGGAVGRGNCPVQLFEDTSIADQHAQILDSQGEFLIRPTGGLVFVEGQPIAGDRALADGETLTLGASRFIFKCAMGR